MGCGGSKDKAGLSTDDIAVNERRRSNTKRDVRRVAVRCVLVTAFVLHSAHRLPHATLPLTLAPSLLRRADDVDHGDAAELEKDLHQCTEVEKTHLMESLKKNDIFGE